MDIFFFLIIFVLGIFIGYCLSAIRDGGKKRIEGAPMPMTEAQKPTTDTESLLEKRLALEEAIAMIERLSETISLSPNLNDLGNEIVKTTCKIFNVEICALLLLDETTDTLKVITSTGIEDKFAHSISIKRGEEISGLVAKFNDIRIIDNLETEAQLYNLNFDRCYKKTLASLPLSFKNKVLGVLNISHKKSGEPFSPKDVEIIKIIASESAVALQNFKLFQEQNKNYLNTIIALANAIDARDPYTYHHSKNVTKYAVRIAEEIQLPTRVTENIRNAGLLHDIGKIGIKDEILMKPAKLSDEEFAEIKLHPLKGEEIIKSLSFLNEVAKIIRHHHERFDGKGYPDGIKGETIEMGARILAIADSFDAMISKRTYRAPLSLEEAKGKLIENKGSQFDSHIVDCLIQILDKEPDLTINNELSHSP